MDLYDFFGLYKEDNKMDMYERWALKDMDARKYIKYSDMYGSFKEDSKMNTYKPDDKKKSTPTKMIGTAKKVIYDPNAGVTVVLWNDGTKTIVRASEGDPHDPYLGYCVAFTKKFHGTNSALKRKLENILVITEKKAEE